MHFQLKILILLCLYFIASLTSANSQVLSGKVVALSDGDTITVLDASNQQHKIRLSGVDSPEKKQPFGQRSKAHLSQLVFDKPVDVEWNKLDRYKRIVGKVTVADPSCGKANCPKTLDAGLSQITVGLAWWYRQYAKEQLPEDRQRYETAEAQARAKRVGLWSENEPTPPWEYRHAGKR